MQVVPAQAGTHTAESIGVARRAAIFAKLVAVVMGPCLRRDDVGVVNVLFELQIHHALAAYFRTQITRTTAALASVEAPSASIPFVLRNSRTASDGTSTACAAGAPLEGREAATDTGFNSASPANLPLSSSAAAPENPIIGGGDNVRSPPPLISLTDALTALMAEPPPWFCGSAMPVRLIVDLTTPGARSSGFN